MSAARGASWIAAVAAAGIAGLGAGWLLLDDDGEVPAATEPAPASTPTSGPASSAPPTTAPPPAPFGAPGDLAGWTAVVQALPPPVLPSDSGLPLDEPESLPNSDRSYRGGTHQGVDFICLEPGHDAVAALPGTVVIANNSFVDPSPEERQAILDQAQVLGRTPPWTLAMLFGRFVVVDHGVVAGAGHVVSVYAHLDEVDPAIRPGAAIEAGTRLGEIGNLGTESAGTGADDPQSIHLHWELHVDDVHLGAGLGIEETRQLYETLFGSPR